MFRVLIAFCLAISFAASEPISAAETSVVTAPGATAGSKEQRFEVKGLVVEVHPEEQSVKIKHEEIPGYMQAMTMTFDVKDTNELKGIEAGDPVSFRMIVNDTYGWIERLKKTGPKQNDLPTTGPFRLVRDVEPLQVGDKLSDYSLTNQLGKAFITAQLKGQVFAINFLFTRCPFPTFCPQTARYFSETQQKLSTNAIISTNWQLLTISFDPEFDKPDVLKRYAEHYNYDPNHWTFATGALIDITALCDQLGLKFWRDQIGGFDHNLRTVVIDASGKVQKIFVGNEWTPEELATEMTRSLIKKP